MNKDDSKENIFNGIIVPGQISLKFDSKILSFFNGGYGLKMVPFFREGWAIEEPKSNPSPSFDLILKFRKHKLKSNPLAISIGSLEPNVKERQIVSSGIRGG